ncbi:MAG TPA: ABC transporter permease [Cyclobacteriaceae bacterium]|nr:ABC transporter permease [Cyclobacteriaceae bacterium]
MKQSPNTAKGFYKYSPPAWAHKFLIRFLRDELSEEVQGDLEEKFYTIVKEKSLFRARINYWFQVLNYLRPFAIKNLTTTYSQLNFIDMFRHNFIVSFRYFQRNKTSFFINMLGLPAGIACALLIWLWVNDELNMDKFHKNDSRLYQVLENVVQDGRTITRESTSGPMAAALAAEMPEVEYAVTTTWPGGLKNQVISLEEKDIEADGMYADSDFFRLFTFEIIMGNKNKALSDKKAMVISEKLSRSLFGNPEDAMGKSLVVQHDKQYIVTGIFRNISARSSMQFDFVLSFAEFRDENEWVTTWYNTAPRTYLLMKPGIDIGEFNRKIAGIVKEKTEGAVDHRTPFATRYTKAYLYNNYVNGIQSGGRIEYVKLFSVIAVFILLVACINFMNLSTARASTRMKEIGIKKTIGAGRNMLIFQYLGESVILSYLSLIVAILVVFLMLPQFNLVTEKHLVLRLDRDLMITCLAITTVTGLIAGSYPALYLSGFSPVTVLKGKIRSATGEIWARKGLVVFQFIISIILIVSVIVVYKQIEFVQTRNLGYDNDNILFFGRNGELQKNEKLESFLNIVRNIPGVKGASNMGHDLAGHNGGTYGVEWPGKDPLDKTEFERFPVNFGAIELLDIQVKEGRTFSQDFPSDSSAIIFNEEAIEFMGLTDPVGKVVKLWGEERTIICVVKNIHYESFREELKPLFFWLFPQNASNVMVKIEAGKEKETIEKLQKAHAEFNPGFPMEYRFLDENYMSLYTTEQRVSTLSKYFAGLAILISCLGLFGLAAFTAERRTKEIGIRKIMGSGEFAIIRLLSGDFTVMVLLAILIALPVSFLIARKWLEGYAFHIDLSIWFFISAGLLALLIAWLTVGMQTWKAARINPVKCLKEE